MRSSPTRGWVRPPAVAGRFYPDDPARLRQAVATYVGEPPSSTVAPKAIIAPHAGYMYSGPVAGTAYATLAPARGKVRRVIVAGPAHYVAVHGVAVSSASSFDTPLGSVEVDDEARTTALQVPGVVIDDEAHAIEHSLEVHLPFLLEVLGDGFKVLPLAVGDGPPSVFAEVLRRLWGGDETRIVVSTDLSHYHDEKTAKAIDRITAETIVDCRYDELANQQACGAAPVRGLLATARRRGLSVRMLDLRTSADTAGPPDRVVGYGAFVVT